MRYKNKEAKIAPLSESACGNKSKNKDVNTPNPPGTCEACAVICANVKTTKTDKNDTSK